MSVEDDLKEKIRELALANGFKLKLQADGTMDLNPYVYDFAEALIMESMIQFSDAQEALRIQGLVGE